MTEKRVIALFDFDGTITTKDSLLQFMLFSFSFFKNMGGWVLYSPIHLLYKLKLVKSTYAKNFFLTYFLKGMPVERYKKLCDEFARHHLRNILNNKAVARLKWHIRNQHTVIIVTASVKDWILPWASTLGIDKIISTELEIANNKLTGKIAGENCNHEEKKRRILEEFPNINDFEVYAYGNSSADRNMFELADKIYFKKFND